MYKQYYKFDILAPDVKALHLVADNFLNKLY